MLAATVIRKAVKLAHYQKSCQAPITTKPAPTATFHLSYLSPRPDTIKEEANRRAERKRAQVTRLESIHFASNPFRIYILQTTPPRKR
jgi:hypothetical protein